MAEMRICKFCGGKFVPKTKTMICCGSTECLALRYRFNSQELRDKKKVEQTKKTKMKRQLVDISVAARQAGMSYGQYVALHGL